MPMCITVKGAGTKGTKSRSIYAFLPSRIFSHNGRRTCQRDCTLPESGFESPCPCTIVSVRSSRVRLNLWFLWRVHVRARTRATAVARRACEWAEDSPWKGVSIERESCACRWPAMRRNVRDKCVHRGGWTRNEREAHFYRRETVRARCYCGGLGGLKVRLDYSPPDDRGPDDQRDLNDLYLVRVACCQIANKAPLNLTPSIRRFLYERNLNATRFWNVTWKSRFSMHAY